MVTTVVGVKEKGTINCFHIVKTIMLGFVNTSHATPGLSSPMGSQTDIFLAGFEEQRKNLQLEVQEVLNIHAKLSLFL